jgi:hypothetical protein
VGQILRVRSRKFVGKNEMPATVCAVSRALGKPWILKS